MITVAPDSVPRGTLLIDFDSTLVSVEALDELAKIVLAGRPDRDAVVARIECVTRMGMEGSITIEKSLDDRLSLLRFGRSDIGRLVARLHGAVTGSFREHAATIAANAARIHVVSGGFLEWVAPVAASLGIPADHCHANRFRFDTEGMAVGIDPASTLASRGGKPRTISALRQSQRWEAPVILVGDGWTDVEARTAGAVDCFIAYTEHAAREAVVAGADGTARSFEDVMAAWRAGGRSAC